MFVGRARFIQCPQSIACLALILFGIQISHASDGGGSVYPLGVDTILSGLLPAPGGTLMFEFNNIYQANRLTGPNGQSVLPGFRVNVTAFGPKIVHNWGLRVLGGTLVSSVAVPIVHADLSAPFGAGRQTGVANPDIGVAAVAYHKGAFHWWYGVDLFPPGFGYQRANLVNIGQHNTALAADGAITWLPQRSKVELSSKLTHIFNLTNPATGYRSGHEFIWEYAAMRQVTRKLAFGANGYFYRQTTADRQSGVPVPGGDQAQVFALGPELRYQFRHYALIAKFQRELTASNRTLGNSFWLQFAIPLAHGRE